MIDWLTLSVKRGFPGLLLTLIPSVADLPVLAQAADLKAAVEISQLSDEGKNQSLQERAAQIVNLLTGEEYAKVRETISPDLAKKLSAEQMEQIWETLIAATGPVKQQLKSRVLNTINADLVIITTEFEKATGDFIVTFNQDGEIVGVDFPKIDTIDRIAEIFINALATNDFPRARGYLHPFLKTEFFPQKVQQQWQELLQQTGRVKRIVEIQVRTGSTVDEVDLVSVTIEFEKVTEDMLVIFDDSRRIVGVNFPEN